MRSTSSSTSSFPEDEEEAENDRSLFPQSHNNTHNVPLHFPLFQQERRAKQGIASTATTTSATSAGRIATKQTTLTIIEDTEAPTNAESTVSAIVNSPTEAAADSALLAPSNSPPLVNLVLTEATLLSGKLDECYHAQDEDCEAGVAAVSTFLRHLNPSNAPSLVFPKFEKQSQFVQVHPLGWSVNRLILQGLFQWKILMSTPSLLLQNKRDNYGSQRDLTYLQDANFPFLITNVVVPPSSSWATDYHKYVHFDTETSIALLSIANSGEPLNHNQIQSAWGALYTIADRNMLLNCIPSQLQTDPQRQALFDSYQELFFQQSAQPTQNQRCWIPVVFFDDGQTGKFQQFIQGIMQHPYPPQLIIDVDGNAPDQYPIPTRVQIQQSELSNSTSTSNSPPKSVWIHSFRRKDDIYYQHQLHLTTEFPQELVNVTLIQQDMEVVPPQYKDELYEQHILTLRQQADQAIQNDPQVGYSTEMPIARQGEIRRCQGGECEIGNLFTDALRWKAQSHIAFVTSGGLRGDGWPAGPVHVSNIWASLPFPNGLCQGVMSGISLFKLLDYAISIGTFESYDTNDGGRLLQVSGMQVVYNTQIPNGSPRLLSIHIWNHDQEEWLPIERLGLYKFATDSYLCGAYDPYPELLGAKGNFTLEGEVPGVIGDDLVQDIVAQYLQQLDAPYDAAIKGRLVNNTENFEVLDLVQTEENCEGKTFWSERRGACFPCPDSSHVEFSDDRLEFHGQQSLGGIIPTDASKDSTIFNATKLNMTDSSLVGSVLQGRILLINREVSNFSVVPKAIPSWLKFVDIEQGQLSDRLVVGGPETNLPSGSSLALDFVVGSENLQSGTALGTVSFGVLGRAIEGDEGIRSCDDYSRDATFDVFLSVTPPQELNSLGNFRIIGLLLMAIALASAIFFGSLIYQFRSTAILKTMQPMFLCTICTGIFIMALAILPMSLDDQAVSQPGADAACMAVPWLLSMGMTVTFSALFSKLWRVNKLFSVRSFRRRKVTAHDVLMPFILLFTLNALLLSVWNALDPLRSVRLVVEGEPWKSYEACRAGNLGYSLMYAAAAVNIAALLLACYQAYQARHISGEFAESKAVGLAIGCWLQVLLVGFPALYLVDPEDITASYFLQVGLLFVLCMSMMCIIFGPLVVMVLQYRKNPRAFQNRRGARGGSVYVTGTSGVGGSTSRFGDNSQYDGSSYGHSQSFDLRGSAQHPFDGRRGSKMSAAQFEGSKRTIMNAVQGVANGDLSASASSMGSHIDCTLHSHFLQPIREDFHDEEVGDVDKERSQRFKSPIEREVPSTQSTENLDLHNEDGDSTCSSSFKVEQPTEQMLLEDLVPPEAMDSFRNVGHESDSTVPFAGDGSFFQENPLLADDSDDSSLPFQGSKCDLLDGSDDDSTTATNEVVHETKEDIEESCEKAVDDDDECSELSDHNEDGNDNNTYRKYLQRGEIASPERTISGHQIFSTSQAGQSKDDEALEQVATALVVATIENRKATQTEEIPFSSRFVEYKNRLRANNEVHNLQEENHNSFLSSQSSLASVGSLMGYDDNQGSGRGSLLSMMNRLDSSNGGSHRGSFLPMRDLSGGSHGSRRGYGQGRLSGGYHSSRRIYSMDRSEPSYGSRRLVAMEMMDHSDPGRARIPRVRVSESESRRLMAEDYAREMLTGRSDPTHVVDPRVEDYSRRRSTDDYSRRRRRSSKDDMILDYGQLPWERSGKRASDASVLGYSLTEEWQGPGYKKKSKGAIKGTITALHQSFAALAPGFGRDEDGNAYDSPQKKKSTFSTLHHSFAALNFSSKDKDKDDVGGANGGDSPRKVKLKSPLAALNLSLPALQFNYKPTDSGKSDSSLELYENEPKDSSANIIDEVIT